jgi:uncharacterized protein
MIDASTKYKNRAEIEAILIEKGLLSERVFEAIHWAEVAHRGQTRHGNTDYVEEHLFGMVEKLVEIYPESEYIEELIIVALLHDAIEDSGVVTAQTIASEFGPNIASYVIALTKTDNDNSYLLRTCEVIEIEDRMLEQIKQKGIVPIVVKLADVWNNNLSTIVISDIKRYSRFVKKLRRLYIPLAKKYSIEFYHLLVEQLKHFESELSRLDFEIMSIDKPSGKDLYVEYYPAKSSNECVVLSHGITVDCHEKGVFDFVKDALIKSGYNVCRFDYTGHGQSDGTTMDYSLETAYEDIEYVIDRLNARGLNKFIFLAASFSGGPVTQFVSQNTESVRGLVYWNSLIDYGSRIDPKEERQIDQWGKEAIRSIKEHGYFLVGSRRQRYSPRLMSEVRKVNYINHLKKIQIPILFLHGNKDESVPLEDSLRHVANKPNVKVAIIDGAEHGFQTEPYTRQATEVLLAFLKNNTNKI